MQRSAACIVFDGKRGRFSLIPEMRTGVFCVLEKKLSQLYEYVKHCFENALVSQTNRSLASFLIPSLFLSFPTVLAKEHKGIKLWHLSKLQEQE